MRNALGEKFVEKIKTHILCSETFFLENLAFCEIILKNISNGGRSQYDACALHAG
jgi:hypothetical protein